MSRFYTDPFRRDAVMVKAVAWSEPRFVGFSRTRAGTFRTWSRTVTFEDGSEHIEDVRSEPVDSFVYSPDEPPFFNIIVR